MVRLRGRRSRPLIQVQYFATCAQGLEEVLAAELRCADIDAKSVKVGSSGVWFRGGWETGYRANLWLRSAVRVLAELSRRRVGDTDQLYEWARGLPWQEVLQLRQTFSVDCRVWDSAITHSKYAALRIKDAICDRFREQCKGVRPDVQIDGANLPLFLYIFKNEAVLYRDLSGTTLHKRGYRAAMHRSSLNEAVASGILLLGGWDGSGDFCDPMCGSGTFAIEAAGIAMRRAPGLRRKRAFPFESWPEFDRELWEHVRADARAQALRKPPCRFMICDRHPGAIALARGDLSRASLDQHVEVFQADIEDWEPPVTPKFVFTNPPWGERLTAEDASQPWRQLGRFLKARCPGASAHVLSGNAELTRYLGMKATQRHPVRIGKFDCRVVRYDVHARRQEDATAPEGQAS